jgi:hypothetical protein
MAPQELRCLGSIGSRKDSQPAQAIFRNGLLKGASGRAKISFWDNQISRGEYGGKNSAA